MGWLESRSRPEHRAQMGAPTNIGAAQMIDWGAVEQTARLMSKSGTMAVLAGLMDGPLGYNALGRSAHLGPKKLNRVLRALVGSGVVERRVISTSPFRVEYSIVGDARRAAIHRLAEASQGLMHSDACAGNENP